MYLVKVSKHLHAAVMINPVSLTGRCEFICIHSQFAVNFKINMVIGYIVHSGSIQ